MDGGRFHARQRTAALWRQPVIELNPPRVLSIGRENLVSKVIGALNAADRLTLAYLVYSTLLIAIRRQNVGQWEVLLPAHFALLAIVAGLAIARARGIKILSALSHWYPPFIFLFFF